MPNPARPSASLEALVRAHFGLSQYELARYLNLTRGFVAHVEAGRKTTPPAALARLTRLALLLPPPEGFGPPDLPTLATPTNPAALPEGPATPLATAPLHARQRDCRLQAFALGQQLARLQARAAAQARRRRGLAQLRQALGVAAPVQLLAPTPAETARVADWLQELAAAAVPADPVAAATQTLLAVRIAALTAEADALNQFLDEADRVPKLEGI